jgi:DNA-binding NarL/FixJ family response regulator
MNGEAPRDNRPTVMVVDDVPENIAVLLDALRATYRLRVAESAESCLEQLPHARPDLILLDVRMPEVDGFALCAQLQADPQWAEVPIIFMTAVDEAEQKHRALELGAVDYVTKPLYVPEVEARVRTHLRLRLLQRELRTQNELLEDEVAMRRETEAQLRQSLSEAVVTAQEDGQVTFLSRLAQNLIQRYFGRSGVAVLPPELLAVWARRESAEGPVKARFPHPDGRSHLEARIHPTGPGMLCRLQETGRRGPALLACLGLSAREAEVVYWLAEGKTNPEIATILGGSVRTVHKHVENAFRKLRVESRGAAMRIALDVLNE